jgi:mRNA interferase RelE/StbE
MYKLLLKRVVTKQLDALPDKDYLRVSKAISGLANVPRPRQCKKLKKSLSQYRVRCGDYRIVYEIDDKRQEVIIYRVRHRKNVYV